MKKQEIEIRFQWSRALIAVLFYALLFSIAYFGGLDMKKFFVTAIPSWPAAAMGIFMANKRE